MNLLNLLYESTKHKEDTGKHPGLYCSESLCLRGVGGDGVEDVDKHQEKSDEERHPAGDHVHGDEERDP